MTGLLGSATRSLRRRLSPPCVRHDGAVLPPRYLRAGGRRLRDDAAYLASAEAEADRLTTGFGLTGQSRVLDVGCGAGRLAIGLRRRPGAVALYRGVDVGREVIDWCDRFLASDDDGFRFLHVDVRNRRYHADGRRLDAGFRFPFDAASFDVVYLSSVFTHMTGDDVAPYLDEFHRLLDDGGRVFLTAFVQDDAPDETENPEGYGPLAWRGPLHCVRYGTAYFGALLAGHGFEIDRLEYETEANRSSAFSLSRRPAPRSPA